MNRGSLGQVKSVSQINAEIRRLLDSEFRFVRVRGEISTIRQPFSGHTYFTLKDHQSQLPAVLFKNQRRWLATEPQEGQQVICDGRISVYEPRGQYQLIVDTIDFDGTGQLRMLFDQLKQKLKEEGLFDQQHKKSLPSVIKNVVLITSPTGAAVHDFISVCTTRHADLSIQILPVRVQGQGAADQICRAIEIAHTLAADVIVLCRGGGSLEDLWSYNEETVARTISEATVPLITGIGHETDFTIADFCADFRCATPTAAAELIATDRTAFEEKIAYVSSRLLRTMTLLLDRHESRLSRMSDLLSTFDKAFSHHTFAIEHLHTRLHNVMALIIEQRESRFSRMRSHLLHLTPDTAISRHQDSLTFLCQRLQERMKQLVQVRQAKLEQSAAVLDTLSPLKTLARGYGIVSKKGQTDGPGTIITSTSQVEESEEVEVRVHQGAMDCRVLRKRN